MKSMLWAAIAVVVATPVQAQESKWGYFQSDQGLLQAGINGSRGSQLILKCDKQGEHRVYAVVVSPSQIAPPAAGAKYLTGEVGLSYDGMAPDADQWRFNDVFAMAMDLNQVRTMTRFGEKLADAETFRITLKPFRLAPVILDFEVAGAKEAMQRVYEACKDKPPF